MICRQDRGNCPADYVVFDSTFVLLTNYRIFIGQSKTNLCQLLYRYLLQFKFSIALLQLEQECDLVILEISSSKGPYNRAWAISRTLSRLNLLLGVDFAVISKIKTAILCHKVRIPRLEVLYGGPLDEAWCRVDKLRTDFKPLLVANEDHNVVTSACGLVLVRGNRHEPLGSISVGPVLIES